jgi:HSP20 family protein
MTRKWSLQTVPASVLTKELSYNRDNLVSVFDRIFDDAFRGISPDIHRTFGIDPFSKASYPKVNVISFNDHVEIEAEIAGYTRDDIEVQIEEDVLSIVGKTSTQSELEEDSVYVLRELKRSSFSRSFRLSDQLDSSKIDATFADGVLHLSIPRKEPTVVKVNKVTIR